VKTISTLVARHRFTNGPPMDVRDEERFEQVIEEFVREDEFTCRGCQMIVHQSRLVDPTGMRCAACVSAERLP
jgi:hypothetical protein